MARITSIRLNNFKRQVADVTLSGKDLIVGSNGVGKSARIQALGTALLGYVPGASGKRPQDTFFYSTGDVMTVGVETEAFGFDRSFVRKVKYNIDGSQDVSISQEITVSPSKGEKTLKAKEARIVEELGSFPVMLDFGQFLAMSDTDRRKFFYSLAGVNGDEWTKERVEGELRAAMLTPTLQQNNPDAYATYEALLTDALKEWSDGVDAEAGVQAMLEWAKSQQRHWNAKKRDAAGAVRQLAELKNQLEETDRGINENRAEIDRLQSEMTDVTAQIARQEEAQKAMERRARRIAELRDRIASLQEPSKVVIDGEDGLPEKVTVAEVEERIASLSSQITATPTDDTDYDGLIRELEVKIRQIEDEADALAENIADRKGAAAGLRKSIQQASERGGICVIAANIACDKDFTPFLEWAKGEVTEASARILEDEKVLAALRSERDQLRDRIRQINERRNTRVLEIKAISDANKALDDQIRDLRQKLKDHDNAEALRLERLSDAEAELSRLESEAASAASIAPSDILIKQRDGIQGQINTLKAKVQEQQKARTTISNMQASMIDSTKAEHSFNGAKFLADILGPKGIQGDMLVGALGPIRDDVTANLRAMGIEHPFFFRTESDRGQEVFRFGWIDDEGREVDFAALSTGQQLIVLIALLVAILDRANPECKILAIDNIENLDRKNFRRVIAGLDVLADRLDNILLAGVVDVDHLDGWTIHRLGVLEEVAV